MAFSDLGKKLARLGQDTKNGVQKMSDSVSINNRISAEKKSLGRLYAVIGEAVYQASPDEPREGLEDEWAAVKVAFANIEAFTQQLNSVKGIVYCPGCGRPASKGDKFCAKCGTKIVLPDDTTRAKVAADLKEAGQEAGRIVTGAADKTGEMVGSAAAGTKNAFTRMKEKMAGFTKGMKEKWARTAEEETSGLEGVSSVEEELASNGPGAEDIAEMRETFGEAIEEPVSGEHPFEAAEEKDVFTAEDEAEDPLGEPMVPGEEAVEAELPAEEEVPEEEDAEEEVLQRKAGKRRKAEAAGEAAVPAEDAEAAEAAEAAGPGEEI